MLIFKHNYKKCGGFVGKIKTFLAALALCAVPVFWSFTTQAVGNFGVESISVLDKSTDVVAETPTVSGNTINSTIVFHTLNDYVTYGLKIKNSTSTSYEILDIYLKKKKYII